MDHVFHWIGKLRCRLDPRQNHPGTSLSSNFVITNEHKRCFGVKIKCIDYFLLFVFFYFVFFFHLTIITTTSANMILFYYCYYYGNDYDYDNDYDFYDYDFYDCDNFIVLLFFLRL